MTGSALAAPHPVKPLFFYGSLRDPALIEIVLGRALDLRDLSAARAHGYATLKAAGEAYPMLVPAPGSVAEGVVLAGVGPADLDRLAYFEEAEYVLAPISVETPWGGIDALHFRGTEKRPASADPWDFAAWRAADRAVALEAARELMAWHGRLPVERIDDIWPGLMIRARQRAAAADEAPPEAGGLRSRFEPADVDILARRHAYASFLAVDELALRHRRYGGGWSAPLARSVVLWGDAVTVLPYDPVRERVVMIEQFRPAAAARGDPCPWCLEVVAGRLDTEEGAEATARREAREEAGLTLGRLWRTGQFYTTPGLAAETITGFIGEAALPAAGPLGLHGQAGENEDIRAFVLSLDEALAAAGRGEVNTGPALVALLWLGAHRRDLRAAWAGG